MRDHLQGRGSSHGIESWPSRMKIVVLSATLICLLAGGAALHIKSKREQIHTDPNTLCPIDQPPSRVIVVLLDMSDEFTEPQRLMIHNELDRLKIGMPPFALIEVYAIDRLEEQVSSPVVHLCNPGTGSEMNRLYQNPVLARRKWDDFDQRLEEELQRLMASPDSKTSAIFEAVQATALRTFNRIEYEGLPKTLVIVSDLLQNMPGKLSQYQEALHFEEFRHTPYFSEIRADLTGVHVTVLYLVRPRAPQKWPDHYRFWEQYFLIQGAIVDRIEPVYGAE